MLKPKDNPEEVYVLNIHIFFVYFGLTRISAILYIAPEKKTKQKNLRRASESDMGHVPDIASIKANYLRRGIELSTKNHLTDTSVLQPGIELLPSSAYWCK